MFSKYKGVVGDDAVFLTVVIVLVGAISFGLGRWSALDFITGTQNATILYSETSPSALENPTNTAQIQDSIEKAEIEVLATGSYVGSKNSDKYHLPWCSGALRIKEENKVWFVSKEEAEQAGYSPAGNCKGL